MTTKKVNRYRCDFCGKQGGSAGHMKRHEERCTKNPNRVCGMCRMLEQEQPSLPDMTAILPDPEQFKSSDPNPDIGWETMDDTGLQEALKGVFPKLRELAGNCPACIMAALRQKGIPVPVAKEFFDFKKEIASIWSELNDREYRREEAATYYG
jgi:hypothetical protein